MDYHVLDDSTIELQEPVVVCTADERWKQVLPNLCFLRFENEVSSFPPFGFAPSTLSSYLELSESSLSSFHSEVDIVCYLHEGEAESYMNWN